MEVKVVKVSSWNSPETARQYLQSLNTEDAFISINKTEYHDPVLYSLLPDLNGKIVADLGTGDFSIPRRLIKDYPHAKFIPVDFVPMLIQAKHPVIHYPEQLRDDLNNQMLVAASADRLPFSNNSLNVIISSLLLHWTPDHETIISEIARVLRPGGRIYNVSGPSGHFSDRSIYR